MIPKILHLYWGRNNPLSFLRYMTVVSFAQLNPDWQIKVHYPKDVHAEITWSSPEHQVNMSNVDDYFDMLIEVPRCEICLTDMDDPIAGLAEVMRSDLVRWKLLAEQGGWWSDFDILFVKPMANLKLDDFISVVGSYQKQIRSEVKHWSIGFLGSDAGDFAKDFFEKVLRNAQAACDPKKYQSCGQFAYTPVQEKWFGHKCLFVLPSTIVYPIQWWDLCNLYSGRVRRRVAQDTIGIHWFGGSRYSQEAERVINKNTVYKHHGMLANYLQACLRQRPL